ncbi:hypothetical protein [Tahibacter aquaticus]|uniref:hypothetical protein n=1 Tax=Tahibacter aquaticus TaxID=520092 RepID=UPI0014151E5A|nr:hypothetical protein [Tahibacter aquaticus]
MPRYTNRRPNIGCFRVKNAARTGVETSVWNAASAPGAGYGAGAEIHAGVPCASLAQRAAAKNQPKRSLRRFANAREKYGENPILSIGSSGWRDEGDRISRRPGSAQQGATL